MSDTQGLPELTYAFRNPELLEEALTHSSLMLKQPDGAARNNERLEFLGDAVLSAVIADELFRRLPATEEGRLTRLRAQLVCGEALADAAERLCLNAYLRLGRSEKNNTGRARRGLIADAMEAIIGAIYLDGGWPAARQFILDQLVDQLDKVIAGDYRSDYKTELQEQLQAGGGILIQYRLDRTEGPEHAKIFYVSVLANGEELGAGFGRSKKEAEQAAARSALENRQAGRNDIVF